MALLEARGADRALRRPPRARRRRHRRRRRARHRPHRAERRGQDHAVQRHQRAAEPAQRGHGAARPARRSTRSRRTSGPASAWRARSNDSSCSRCSPCARTSRVAGEIRKNYARRQPAGRRRDHRARRARRLASTTASTSCRPARRGWWSSHARSRPGPRCCCSTSRRRASTSSETDQLGALLRALAGEGIAVLLVEHDMHLVMEVCDLIHVLDFGRIIAAGDAAEIQHRRSGARRVPRRQPGGDVTAIPPATDVETPLLELRGIKAAYGRIDVLHGVDLVVPAGQGASRILGPNGAGSRRRSRSRAGCIAPTAGDLFVAGRRVNGATPDELARAGLCLIPEGKGIFPNLTVRENLRMCTFTGPLAARRSRRSRSRGSRASRERRTPARGHAVGRRAADARDGPRPRDRSRAAPPRRAVDGAGADHRRGAVRDRGARSRARACRSSSSSSSRRPSWASPTRRRSWCTARSPRSARPPSSPSSCRPPTWAVSSRDRPSEHVQRQVGTVGRS